MAISTLSASCGAFDSRNAAKSLSANDDGEALMYFFRVTIYARPHTN